MSIQERISRLERKVKCLNCNNSGGDGTSIHNNLQGLQGGQPGQYYHLTQEEYDSLGTNNQNNINRIPSATYSELGITPESTIEEKQTAISNFLEGYDNAETDNLFFEIKENEPLPISFDVTADWASINGFPVTDQASFELFLQNYSYFSFTNDLTDIIITDFNLVSNRLTCNLLANGTTLTLASAYVSEFNSIGNINGLLNIDLYSNDLISFNPTVALPNTLTYLSLNTGNLVEFNPTIPLPTSLTTLDLNNNHFTPSGYAVSEQWATLQPSFNSPCTVSIQYGENSVSGTNLETILISKNCIVIP